MQRIFYVIIFLFSFSILSAQEEEGSGVSDTIVYIQDTDTIREIIIEEVSITDESKVKLTKEEREQLKLLERRVRVV